MSLFWWPNGLTELENSTGSVLLRTQVGRVSVWLFLLTSSL